MLFAGVLEVDAAGEPQLVLCQAQLFECLFGRDQAEALPREGGRETCNTGVLLLGFPLRHLGSQGTAC